MEWGEIISAAVTSGVIITSFELARDWKNKRNKDKAEVEKRKVEVRQTDYEAQKQGLDLVQEFYNKVKQVTDDQNEELFKRLDNIEGKQDKLESLQQDMVTYLNGDFAKWREEHNRKEDIHG